MITAGRENCPEYLTRDVRLRDSFGNRMMEGSF